MKLIMHTANVLNHLYNNTQGYEIYEKISFINTKLKHLLIHEKI